MTLITVTIAKKLSGYAGNTNGKIGFVRTVLMVYNEKLCIAIREEKKKKKTKGREKRRRKKRGRRKGWRLVNGCKIPDTRSETYQLPLKW